MKDNSGEKTKLRVVDEGPADGDAVRLGDSEEVMRLGEKGAEPVDGSTLQRLEVAQGAGKEGRHATVEEILDAESGVESPEGPLEESWGGEAKRWLAVPWGWFVVIGLICVGFATWSMRHIFQHRGEAHLAVERADAALEEDRRREEEARMIYQRLEESVENYLASTTVEGRLKHVRDPERVGPLMREWYRGHPLEPEEITRLGAFRPVTLEQETYWVVNVATPKGDRELLVQQTGDDQGLIDWELDVCFQPMDWDRFVKERPEGSFEFRVFIRADNFYVYEFRDQSQYRSFRLTTRGSEEHLYGYVRRGTEADRRIVSMIRGGRRTFPMILELHFPIHMNAPRSVVISKVVASRWWVSGDAP